jgi:hypothetical protein
VSCNLSPQPVLEMTVVTCNLHHLLFPTIARPTHDNNSTPIILKQPAIIYIHGHKNCNLLEHGMHLPANMKLFQGD